MKTHNLIPMMMIAAVLGMTASRPAHAWSHPDINLAFGTTIGAADNNPSVTGPPVSGGASVVFSPMWPIANHASFGVSLFADDLGSHVARLYDPNDHTDLGLASFAHRSAWGAAWRGDVDVARHGRWAALASGTWGWSRMTDDLRGRTYAAASAVSVGLAGEIRGPVAPAQTLGLVWRWQRLFAQRNAAYDRRTTYATVALEWGWTGAPRP